MEKRISPLRKSWLPAILFTAAVTAFGAFGAVMFLGGLQENEFSMIVIGGLISLGGIILVPAIIFTTLTEKRGGYGQCPNCYNKIVTVRGEERNLLCVCGTYLDVTGDQFETIEPTRTYKKPAFAAPTPWPKFNVISSTISLSMQDYVTDKIGELTAKKAVKLLSATWPPGCCVCGKPATRTEQFALSVTLAGNVRDTKATLLANDVPYCAEHKDGIAFDRVSFCTRGSDSTYGILFRSHAYREAFRTLNRWNWPGIVPPPPGKPPSSPS